MHKLTGYCDRWSVKPGAVAAFRISSQGGKTFDARVVRHICADPNPQGPGYSEIEMPSALDGSHSGREQHAWLGSFGHVPALAADLSGGISLTATIWPTTPGKGRQGVVSLRIGDWTLCLGIGPGGGAMLEATSPAGVVRAEVPARLLERRWYDLIGTTDAAGRLHVIQRPRAALRDAGDALAIGAAQPAISPASVFFAAMPPDGSGAPASAHYNGKLEAPAIWRGQPGGTPIAAWDFTVGIPTQIAAETGQLAAHAQLRNLPTRAMTGADWTGDIHDWRAAPGQYGAIHFHDDDQGDLGWQDTLSLTIPGDWPSGFYALHIRNAAAQDYIPFFVRPKRATADVALLVPTFSYQVYGCYVRPGRGAEIAERAEQWGALSETPDMNRQFGLSCYNYHSDGSGVGMVSQFRPMLDTRPRQFSLMDPVPGGSGTGRIAADSYFVKWMTDLGIVHDIITDHDVHAEGEDLLSQYRVVIAAQHPEYHSERMMIGFERFLEGGGRLMYLGGNGFYWRAEPSATDPHALEIRRAEGGIRVWATEPGENHAQFGGGLGGLWRRIGRSSHKLVGISFSSQGRHLGFPFVTTPAIDDPRVAFMTHDCTLPPGTVFGDSGYMGGGAAGFELDSVNAKYGTPPNALVVAKGVVIHPDYGWVNEDMLTHRHPLPPQDWSCADMTFFETPAGGAVFSVGSMTYAGSLPMNTPISRLTANVLRRFIDPTPFELPPAA
jgi:N,N-dimethylformamidase